MMTPRTATARPTPQHRPADEQEDPLAWLVAPTSSDAFLRDYFERRPLVSLGRDPQRFAALLSISEVDAFVATADLRENMLQLANYKAPVPPQSYVRSDGRIDPAAVARAYAAGSTIVLNQLHEAMCQLGSFCRGLAHAFSCDVTTNIYLTPPGNQGFPAHYDNHDVMVLQLAGRKAWRLYETAVEAPYRGERFEQSGFEAREVTRAFTLGPGDFLYLPRGIMHDAQNAGDEPSLHITVGFFTRKWADLMLEAVSELALAEPAFRRSLPPGFATRDFDREQACRQFAQLTALIADHARMDGALDVLTDSFLRSRKPDVLGAIEGAAMPKQGARFRRRPFVPWTIAADEEGIVLVGPGGDLPFAEADGDALEMALSGAPFTARDLPSSSADPIISALWANGYLERCP